MGASPAVLYLWGPGQAALSLLLKFLLVIEYYHSLSKFMLYPETALTYEYDYTS